MKQIQANVRALIDAEKRGALKMREIAAKELEKMHREHEEGWLNGPLEAANRIRSIDVVATTDGLIFTKD
jgi:hypothetical protein